MGGDPTKKVGWPPPPSSASGPSSGAPSPASHRRHPRAGPNRSHLTLTPRPTPPRRLGLSGCAPPARKALLVRWWWCVVITYGISAGTRACSGTQACSGKHASGSRPRARACCTRMLRPLRVVRPVLDPPLHHWGTASR